MYWIYRCFPFSSVYSVYDFHVTGHPALLRNGLFKGDYNKRENFITGEEFCETEWISPCVFFFYPPRRRR
jgi:hypothetical protein